MLRMTLRNAARKPQLRVMQKANPNIDPADYNAIQVASAKPLNTALSRARMG